MQEYGVSIFHACPTKSALKKALKKSQITVNGTIASTATLITGGETIELSIPEEALRPKKKLIFPLKVIHEDEHLALVHKPAGILVSGNGFMTIANALDQNLKQSSQPDATLPRPIHRLDYATTGILLCGKTSSCIRALSKLFQDKLVQKTYFAIAIGQMNTSGSITTPIDGKPSKSHFELIESVSSERFGTLNLVKLSPETGRRHQLRKHLAGLGNPILGDKDYGQEGLILNGKGLYLHAHSIAFKHPVSKEPVTLASPLPEKFSKIFPSQGKF
ncbi:RluA family pseudouridine synthase [Roseivirga pacifica]|uniref:RluA family pseudouridine synthase n=1 Tax=Roseivirga pacifica TaxID=1267423 RepID=UPI003BA84A44